MKKKRIIISISIVAVLLLSAAIVMVSVGKTPFHDFVYGNKDAQVAYTESGIFKTGTGYHVDHYLYGKERKAILDANDNTMIATVNDEKVTMKDFMLTRLTKDYLSAMSGKAILTNEEVFDSIVRNRVIDQDCAKRNITVTDQEAIQIVDADHAQLLQTANTTTTTVTTTRSGDASGEELTSIVVSADSPSSNEGKTALDYFNQELEGLGITYAQYRTGYGKDAVKTLLLKARHGQTVASEKGWPEESAQTQYEQYVTELIKNATIKKTKAFPAH